MVKSVLGVGHLGLKQWKLQRLSAIFMAVYSVWLVFYLVFSPNLDFSTWHALFSQLGMKIATLLFLASLIYHAWIGVWTVLTDYIKITVLRAILDFLVFLMLAICLIWGVIIVWSV